jgi:hypothetical protein
MLAAFVAAWGSSGPYVFDNEDFEPPTDAVWARVAVRHSGAGQETLGGPGNRKFERRGAVITQVFVPQGTGTTVLSGLLAAVRGTFEGVTLAGTTVRFGDVVVRENGPDGSWFMSTVEAQFTYDEKR